MNRVVWVVGGVVDDCLERFGGRWVYGEHVPVEFAFGLNLYGSSGHVHLVDVEADGFATS
jgi:hypothetical protein